MHLFLRMGAHATLHAVELASGVAHSPVRLEESWKVRPSVTRMIGVLGTEQCGMAASGSGVSSLSQVEPA